MHSGSDGIRFVLVAGTTETAQREGISAAGADPDLMATTPAADAELVTYGRPVRTETVPVSPSGCPTPALVTRAVREVLGFDLAVVDGGLAERTGAPTITVGARPGKDIGEQDPVPTAYGAFEAARQFGHRLPADELWLAESVPGGTTTALGVLRALGETSMVSSSLPENPIEQKERAVSQGLAASSMAPGDAAGEPKRALRRMGDPVLATLAGLTAGAVETDTAVTLAGGSQQLAVAALVRHGGYEGRLGLATTSYVADDQTAALRSDADALSLDLTVTDPGFEGADHVAMDRFVAGEAKEGVGMGGALALADRAGVPMADVRDRFATVYDDLVETPVADEEHR
ncbi:nicotinate-nucleotide--dimethylbenzimidazole phosphoribosyltransferase [Halomicroarcula sp. GCM10025324]|uniref:nicotinate-nucleotide--dimethylbenzimidazole phosphoribosyltransferase n=1 Tax=Haloarcula TaxID=2237 RepID=UPI0023E8F42B|nr:nicotinate-nucleotide--dimethylbenzimidazole phosphoribosyltransferase [Halomicroarcula sp. ZS-22-S1]